jgi:hypothetical protein
MLDLLYIGFFLLISPSACDCPDFKTQDVKVLIAHFLGCWCLHCFCMTRNNFKHD